MQLLKHEFELFCHPECKAKDLRRRRKKERKKKKNCICREEMQAPGFKLFKAYLTLFLGNVEGDIKLKFLHIHGFGYGFLASQCHLDLQAGGPRYISHFHDIRLKFVKRYIV
jgi:hypothetical protein